MGLSRRKTPIGSGFLSLKCTFCSRRAGLLWSRAACPASEGGIDVRCARTPAHCNRSPRREEVILI